MTICRFYQMGTCKFGANCKYEHPNQNRFGGFGSNASQTSHNSTAAPARDTPPFNVSALVIEKDTKDELPQWILSAYGPGRDAPIQLFGGYPMEQSFEEIRLHYYQGAQAGNEQQALLDIQQLYTNARAQIDKAASNPQEAAQYVINGQNSHPNRLDIVRQINSTAGPTNGHFSRERRSGESNQGTLGSSPFGSSTQASGGSAFGQPSQLGARPNPFGQPAFGQPAGSIGGGSVFGSNTNTNSTNTNLGGGSVFGQPKPSPFGSSTAASSSSAFGQYASGSSPFGASTNTNTTTSSSPFGSGGNATQNTSSPFGQAASSSVFGSSTTSAFGQPARTNSVFGQPAASSAPSSSVFGKPATSSVFGQSTASSSSVFGQPSTTTTSGPTGGSVFGQPSNLGTKSSPFGGASSSTGGSVFGQSTFGSSPSPFGQPAAAAAGGAVPSTPTNATTGSGFSAFANKTPNTNSVFGSSSSTNAGGSVFGSTTPAANTSSPFGTVSNTTATPSASNPFGAPKPSPFGSSTTNTTSSPFGAVTNTNVANGFGSSPFGQPQQQPQQQQPQSQPQSSTTNPYPPTSTRQHPPLSSYAAHSGDGKLMTWNGQQVVYNAEGQPGYRLGGNGKWIRIFFPSGPPNYYHDTEADVNDVVDDSSTAPPQATPPPAWKLTTAQVRKIQEAWTSFAETNSFGLDEGLIPELPPPRELCLWNL